MPPRIRPKSSSSTRRPPIYFGIEAHAAPGSVHATLANRDRIDADDAIQIFLNPFKDGRQALVFGVNPLGIQADGTLVEGTNNRGGALVQRARERPRGDRPDARLRLPVEGTAHRHGYVIEIAIPFKTLRFPADRVQSWALNIVRIVQSSGHEDSWAPALRAKSSFLAQSGTLDGLTDLHRGLVLDLNPVATAHADGTPSGGRWHYDTSRPEFGGNVRWGVTPNLTLNGTINPDFSQVEADASQFTFDPRSALFFPEKRPFFLDGAELFNTPNNLIYTRRIAAPIAAVKLTGTAAGTDIALLSAVDDHGDVGERGRPSDLQHRPAAARSAAVVQGRLRVHRSDRRRQLQPRARGRRAPAVRIDLQPAAAGRRAAARSPADERRPRRSGRRSSIATAAISACAIRRPGSTKTFRRRAASSAARGVITTNLTHRGHLVRRRERAGPELDDERAGERRAAVPQRAGHAARCLAREEAAFQQQLQVPRRMARGGVGAVRVVRVRRAVLRRLRARRHPPRRGRKSSRSPASRTSATTTTW